MAKNYRIGDTADMLQLKTSVLRFWESQFPQLRPLRTGKGQRLYSEDSLTLLRRIRFLLYDMGMTIDGARRVLASEACQDTTKRARRRASEADAVPVFQTEDMVSSEPAGLRHSNQRCEETAIPAVVPGDADEAGTQRKSACRRRILQELVQLRQLLAGTGQCQGEKI